MRSSTFALPVLSLLASAKAFSLITESDNAALDNQKISGLHEGAGINYAFLSGLASDFAYNTTDKILTQTGSVYPYPFSISSQGTVVFGEDGEPVEFDHDVLKYNGSSNGFYACKNTGDIYDYSASQYAVVYFANEKPTFTDCVAIKIKKTEGASSSAAPSSAAPSTSGYHNTTTKYTTVTDYTTYCPESTTITVTTCADHKCGPKAITVTKPGTITITESCVVPVSSTKAPSSAPAATTTKAPAPAKSSTAAPSSKHPVSTYEGNAGKNIAGGLAGAVAIAALLV